MYKVGAGAYGNDKAPRPSVVKAEQSGNKNRSASRSLRKAAPKVQVVPARRPLEKRIYQVNDLKRMGILKNNANNQSESNLRLPAIETATLNNTDFTDDGQAYPKSSLPYINQTMNNSVSTYNVFGAGSQSLATIAPQHQNSSYLLPHGPANRNAGSSEGPHRNQSQFIAPTPAFSHNSNYRQLNPSQQQVSTLKQPA